MSDMDDRMRELFRRKAEDVPSHRQVPRSLAGRARRRIALNALGVAVAVVVIAGGAFAGIQTLEGGSGQPAADVETSPPAQPSPSSHERPGPPACTSNQLRANATMEGAAGSREGSIDLENFSDHVCILQGTPLITLLDRNLKQDMGGVSFTESSAGWQVDGSPEPPGWPVVTLSPGDAALVRIRWSNWCPDGRPAPLWRIGIPGSGDADVINGMDSVSPPPCNSPNQAWPSTVEVGPFEPATGTY